MSLPRDRTEIARVAINNPGSMAAAVSARFGVTRERASKLIHLAREAGFDIPRDSVIRVYDRAEVARVAVAAGPKMGAVVAEHFVVSRTHANRLIELARQEGHNIPRLRERPMVDIEPVSRFDGLALFCACGESCGLSFADLLRHTANTHKRFPTKAERIPQDVRKVAA